VHSRLYTSALLAPGEQRQTAPAAWRRTNELELWQKRRGTLVAVTLPSDYCTTAFSRDLAVSRGACATRSQHGESSAPGESARHTPVSRAHARWMPGKLDLSALYRARYSITTPDLRTALHHPEAPVRRPRCRHRSMVYFLQGALIGCGSRDDYQGRPLRIRVGALTPGRQFTPAPAAPVVAPGLVPLSGRGPYGINWPRERGSWYHTPVAKLSTIGYTTPGAEGRLISGSSSDQGFRRF